MSYPSDTDFSDLHNGMMYRIAQSMLQNTILLLHFASHIGLKLTVTTANNPSAVLGKLIALGIESDICEIAKCAHLPALRNDTFP